ncbi:dihydrofolate reductase family protein [Aquipuribacter nitratireducens]|uniref:Dihydrofolate reductase family protein n=1 Tax=Aquipuribacter nitratireducens TaxID=650104 RepID=A0ABW0GMI9_9MICO
MGRLRYSALCSLDGYVADRDGGFEWAFPDEEVMALVNDLGDETPVQVYGRRTYELMTVWETDPSVGDTPQAARFAEQWVRARKVVVSRTLDAVTTSRTELVRELDGALVSDLTADADAVIGGPTVASAAFRQGLVDRVDLVVFPVTVGGGLAAMPTDLRVDLRLVTERRFAGGAVHLGYDVRREP